MKILNKKILMILFLLFLSPTANALLNPSAVYCKAMNYTYFSRTIAEGEVGYCRVASNVEVDAWEFYMGRVAQDYSYCKKMGYGIKILDDVVYCVLPDKTEKNIDTLMNLNFVETTCGDGNCGLPENYITCQADCPSGSYDDYCDGISDYKCDEDCIDFDTLEKDADCASVQVAACGNNRCDLNETENNCCRDCGCDEGFGCMDNECIAIQKEKCGNSICEQNENYNNCKEDCSGLADGICDGIVDKKCDPDCKMEKDVDCSTCGNNICNENENYLKCSIDCKSGAADGYCDSIEDKKCDPDCSKDEDKDCKGINWFIVAIASLIVVIIIVIVLTSSVKVNEK